MKDWIRDKAPTDEARPHVIEILESFYNLPLSVTSDAEDMAGCDLKGKENGEPRIGVRLREHGFLATYPDDFTIRSNRLSGTETELSKIITGKSNLNFIAYGFMNEECSGVVKLSSIVVSIHQPGVLDFLNAPIAVKTNYDGETSFHAFSVNAAKQIGLVDFTWEEGKSFTYQRNQ